MPNRIRREKFLLSETRIQAAHPTISRRTSKTEHPRVSEVFAHSLET